MRIGLDLDGCIADWSMQVRKDLVKEFGYDPKKLRVDPPSEVEQWWWPDPLGVDPAHWEWVWKVWAPRGGFRTLPLHKDGPTLLAAAKRAGDVVICTSRPKCAWFDTLYWLDYYDVGPPKEVHFYTDGRLKSEAACDVYIEDAPHYAQALQDSGMAVLVPERPYNDVPWLEGGRGSASWIASYLEINYA